MCMTVRRSVMSKTVLYAGEVVKDGKIIHVVGYQNKAENLDPGPNAMILPFPAKVQMDQDNMIDTSKHKHILRDIEKAVDASHQTLGYDYRKGLRSLDVDNLVKVFDSGEYTVVLAQQASLIPEAMKQVPENKRPEIKKEFFEALDKWYANWPVAVCCFEAKKVDAAPLLWWYEPKSTKFFFLPALDAHNGEVPVLDANVEVDHTIAIVSDPGHGVTVRYRDTLSDDIKPYLPERVDGHQLKGTYKNGDFYVTKDKNGNVKVGRFNPLEIAQKAQA